MARKPGKGGGLHPARCKAMRFGGTDSALGQVDGKSLEQEVVIGASAADQ